jgi:hypothetical protein
VSRVVVRSLIRAAESLCVVSSRSSARAAVGADKRAAESVELRDDELLATAAAWFVGIGTSAAQGSCAKVTDRGPRRRS